MLESLYPPSRHGPDRCLNCGHSFDNHLKSWWFPNLYTPFDQHLDDIFERYTVDYSSEQIDRNKASRKRQSRTISKTDVPGKSFESSDFGLTPVFFEGKHQFRKREFHKQYVTDITNENLRGVERKRNLDTRYNDRRSDANQRETRAKNLFQKKYEHRRMLGIKYKVPAIDVSNEELGLQKGLLLALTRTIVLERFDAFLWIQDRDNRWFEWKRLRGL